MSSPGTGPRSKAGKAQAEKKAAAKEKGAATRAANKAKKAG